MSTFPTDAEREAVQRAVAEVMACGHDEAGRCGACVEEASAILDALAPFVADRERAAAARALREAAEAAARVPDCALYLWLDDRAKWAALEAGAVKSE